MASLAPPFCPHMINALPPHAHVRNPTKDLLISGQSALPPEAKLPQHNTNVHPKAVAANKQFLLHAFKSVVKSPSFTVNAQCCYSEFAHLHQPSPTGAAYSFTTQANFSIVTHIE